MITEDIGGRYFEVLVKKSFSGKIQFQHIIYYQMHELPHDARTLPSRGQLPFLKLLTLDGMPKIKRLKNKFNGNDKYHAFPFCPKLRELPSLPSKLKTLETYKIGWMTLNFCSNSDYIPLEII
ncbi:hypothetical protein IEQ34_021394 [Dendrobium chrysotoxum]|uniref:Uncharacterized protein n=1 Tax=Dendrobium chrysotoxum TaxID=161865 RepID=A0AAV7G3C7_DENCH|nr:hypothetical protein IEQ34_021394 [Dendrobium chrysotoxum]